MGLGLLGRGIGDTAFLYECGAQLTVTDLKTEEELEISLDRLKNCENIRYVLGGHKLEDFQDTDMILKAAGVPLDSIYIKEAEQNNIPIEMSSALVRKLSPATIIGVTGTRGKSTVTNLIYSILKEARKGVFLGGNVKDIATLPLLKEANEGDYIVMELDSWQLQGFGVAKMSPHISVFTTFFPDHMNYYNDNMELYWIDKENIFAFQTKDDYLVAGKAVAEKIKERKIQLASTIIISGKEKLTETRSLSIPGEHNRDNAALAVEVAKIVGVKESIIKKVVEEFQGVEGRLQYIRTVRGVVIYNDNNATTPDATIAGLKALGKEKNIILIMGGSDKGLDMSELIREIPHCCKAVVLFKDKGTDRIKDEIFSLQNVKVFEEGNLADCVNRSMEIAKEGDTILYSPAFASFGKYFKNEYDRNDQFIALVDNIV